MRRSFTLNTFRVSAIQKVINTAAYLSTELHLTEVCQATRCTRRRISCSCRSPASLRLCCLGWLGGIPGGGVQARRSRGRALSLLLRLLLVVVEPPYRADSSPDKK